MNRFGRCLLALFRWFGIGRTPTRQPVRPRTWQGNGGRMSPPPSETDSIYATLQPGGTSRR
jgi:hypothetical protein